MMGLLKAPSPSRWTDWSVAQFWPAALPTVPILTPQGHLLCPGQCHLTRPISPHRGSQSENRSDRPDRPLPLGGPPACLSLACHNTETTSQPHMLSHNEIPVCPGVLPACLSVTSTHGRALERSPWILTTTGGWMSQSIIYINHSVNPTNYRDLGPSVSI